MKTSIKPPEYPEDYLKRLLNEYQEYQKLIVAFDFDNTIFDYHNKGIDCSEIIDLLKRCSDKGFTMILFTCTDKEDRLDWKKRYCEHFGIKVDFINESPVMNTRKPFYNILLDDRAGLEEAANLLNSVLIHLEHDHTKSY